MFKYIIPRIKYNNIYKNFLQLKKKYMIYVRK